MAKKDKPEDPTPEPSADDMAAPPAEQPVETLSDSDIPEPPSGGEYPDAPVLSTEALKGEVIVVIGGNTFMQQFPGESEEKRKAVVEFKPEDDIKYTKDDEKHVLEAGEVGKFFTASKRIVFAMDAWLSEATPFATAKKVKVVTATDSKGKATKGIKFVAP